VLYNGHNGGGVDFPCPGQSETSDGCACQIRCRRKCGNAIEVYRRIAECGIVSLNADVSWATLKKDPPPSDWISRAEAREYLGALAGSKRSHSATEPSRSGKLGLGSLFASVLRGGGAARGESGRLGGAAGAPSAVALGPEGAHEALEMARLSSP